MSSIVSSLIRQAQEQRAADRERWTRERWQRQAAESAARATCRKELTPIVTPWQGRLVHMNDMPVAAVLCMLQAFAPHYAAHQPSTIQEIDDFCEGVDLRRITWGVLATYAAEEAARMEGLFKIRLPQLWRDLGLLGQSPDKDDA